MREKILGPVILDIASTTLSEEDKHIISAPEVGGVILFSRNYESLPQLKELVKAIKQINPWLILAVDHEGGRVQRFRQGFTPIPPMQAYGNYYIVDKPAALMAAHETGWLLAAELLACDIDISFAPVLDVDHSLSDIIGDRAFSADPNQVVALASAFIDGMREAGMACTGKHFPGHGGVKADSHLELPEDPRIMNQLENRDLIPFKKLLPKLDAVMPAHIVFSAIDSKPVGFSPYWIKTVLKKEMGFTGVVFSDDLSMEGAAVGGNYLERTKLALAAGCNAILVCNNRPAAIEVLEYLAKSGGGIIPTNLGEMRKKQTIHEDQLKMNSRWQKALTTIEKVRAFI